MAQLILQSFLNEHIISIDQHEEFAFLQKAVTELEKRIRSKKIRISTVTQLAFDPESDFSEPLMAEVQELITTKWKAFPSKSKDRPIPYLRAVMLSALQQLSTEVSYAGIIWLTASNYFKYMKPLEREASILRNFLEEVGNLFEQGSWHVWQGSSNRLELGAPSVPTGALPNVALISKDFIIKQLSLSVSGEEEGGNKHHISSYHDQYYGGQKNLSLSPQWATAYSTIAGNAIKSVADFIAKGVDKSLTEAVSVKAYTEFAKEISRYLGEVSELLNRQTASHNLRGQLLWLKETLYSTSQNTSYRKLSLPALGPILAYDAAELIPAVYPVSVDYFLRETLREVTIDTESLLTFAELLPELATDNTLQAVLPQITTAQTGRMSMLLFVRKLVHGTITTESFESATGIALQDSITRQEMSIWLFHELQVLKLEETK